MTKENLVSVEYNEKHWCRWRKTTIAEPILPSISCIFESLERGYRWRKGKESNKKSLFSPLVGNLGVVMFSLQIQGLFLSVVRRIHTIPLYLPPALVQTCAQWSSSNPAALKNKRTRETSKLERERQKIHVFKSRGFWYLDNDWDVKFPYTPCLSFGTIFHCTILFTFDNRNLAIVPVQKPPVVQFWYLVNAGTNKTMTKTKFLHFLFNRKFMG